MNWNIHDLWPALCYLLEWHYQHLIFDEDGPFIIRQHAVALLALIGPGLQRDPGAAPASSPLQRQLVDKLFVCFSKWFTAAERNGANEVINGRVLRFALMRRKRDLRGFYFCLFCFKFSQKLLLAGCLWTAARAKSIGGPEPYETFLQKYLTPFVRSRCFNVIIQTISSSSLILTHFEDRGQYGIASLPTLGAVQVRYRQTIPTLIVTRTYPVVLLHALLRLTRNEQLSQLENEIFGCDAHRHYLEAVCARTADGKQKDADGLIGNWFVQTIEQRYLLDFLALLGRGKGGERQTSVSSDGIDRTIALQLAFSITCTISETFYTALVKLFDDIIFVPGYYGSVAAQLAVSGADLQRWKLNFKLLAQRVVQNEVNFTPERDGFTATGWKSPLLRSSWPYSPLYLMVDKLEKGTPKLDLLAESAIIDTGLRFPELLEACGMTIANPTECLMYLLAAFLGPDSKFLEPDHSAVIERRLGALRSLAAGGGAVFAFETTKIEDRKSFYGLYQLALDVFQSSSYGHAGFGSVLMAPLAQQYDVRWRNMVWSEYVAVLRFITCGEHELFGELEQYLRPAESDIVLLRSYGQALNSNLLRPGSIPHRVANHHVQAHRSKVKVMPPLSAGNAVDGRLQDAGN
uniref:RPAP1/MINIYO-like TPR repeats domain-containing protein n=1 Tax=Anopheles dirus TaxID=7168 RepID=A0A182N5V9_9DIPT